MNALFSISNTKFPSIGDSLMLQEIPRLLYEKYGVYSAVYSGNKYYQQQTYDLLYKINPYIKGISDNVDIDGDYLLTNAKFNTWMPDHINNCLGIDTFGIIPKIYYNPKKIDGLTGYILIDVASRSYKQFVNERGYVVAGFIKDRKTITIEFKEKDSNVNRFQFGNRSNNIHILIDNIFQYCDVLNSVEEIIAFNSGSALVASSIKHYYNHDMSLNIINLPYPFDNQNYNPPNANIIIC